jgi:hypothetical protein
MNTRRWLTMGCTVALLTGLVVGSPAPSSLAEVLTSEHYRLAVSEAGSVPAVMGSDSYVLNRGVANHAEVASLMESEHYRVSGAVPSRLYLPLLVRTSH